jgi:hypothetical protein
MATGNDLVLYLVLAPEFGGTRFGPFEGLEARLGSSKERSHITLPESLGVAKEHCKVIRQGGASMILAPSERTAAVFLWKGDARRPVQVQTPTAVRPGDSFSLVTPEGPRFFIELGELPPEIKAARQPAHRSAKNLTAGKFASAGRDLLLARLYTLSPVSIAMRAWYFVKSGAIWQPRIILLGMISLFGYVASCGSLAGAFKFRSDANAAKADAEECKQSLAFAGNMGDNIERYTFPQLASTIMAEIAIGEGLEKDDAFKGMVLAEAKSIAQDISPYAWMYEESKRPKEFAQWREVVEKSEKLDPATKKLLPYLAAVRKRTQGEFDLVLDSKDAEVCGRGAVRMTWRQGRNLGLSNLMLDAFVPGDATPLIEDEVGRSQLLSKTAEAGGDPPLDGNLASTVERVRGGESACVIAQGDDDRENESRVLKVIEEHLGRKADGVPDADTAFGPTARLTKFFAADLASARFAGASKPPINFGRGSPAQALRDVPGGKWPVEKAAEVIARAVVLPCEAVLNGERAKMEAIFGTLPDPITCLVLNYKLTHDS